jgi:hypothetical protein
LTHDPTTPDPTAHDPTAHDPTAHEPGAHEPGAHEPGAREPGAREPGGHRPMARDSHGSAGRGLPGELAELLAQIVPPGGAFRHRQHIHLAFLAVHRYGTAEATARIGQWIRHLAAYERAPQKYNATVTRAWTEIVGQHVAADPASTDFDGFAERHPALLDKRLLTRHYSPAVLASVRARRTWAEPDLIPFPWQE